jgi:meso-butanediol dehydrogenase / (S,S)-butanediol dehydrogenase / diacetyl reductase
MAFAGSVMHVTEEQWSRLMRVNLDGTFFMARLTMPRLLRSKGTFTAISSDAGVQGAG